MNENADTVVPNTPVIAGGIYERKRGSSMEQAVCLARIEEAGRVWGLFRRFGMAFERFQEGTEEMLVWNLVWAPPAPKKPKVMAKVEGPANGAELSPRTGKPLRKYTKRK